MGHDVRNIGNHSLDTSTIEALAKDLSTRFKINVEYGYYDDHWSDLEGNDREPTFDYIVYGKIIYPDAIKTLWLTNEFYRVHQLIEKFGDQVYDLPYFKDRDSNNYEIAEALNSVCFNLRDNEEDDEYGVIYNDVFVDWFDYFGPRWWSFCKAFTVKNEDGWLLEIVNTYRQKVKEFYTKIDGTAVFYFDDQGKTQYLTENHYDWTTILKEVETNFKDSTLNISEFMKQQKLLGYDQLPLALYDDFADL